LWRYKWLIAAVAILAAAVAYGMSTAQPPVYSSTGLVLLNDPRTGGELTSEFTLFYDPTRYIRNQVTVIQSTPVKERTVEIMEEKGFPPDTIVVNVTAQVENDLDAMSVNSEGEDADQTTAMVDSTVEAYGDVISGQVQAAADREIAKLEESKVTLTVQIEALEVQLEDDPDDPVLGAELTAATQQLISIEGRIQDLSTEALLYGTGIQLFLSPNQPGSQIAPRPLRNAAIAFILGALAAGAFAWWRAEQDQRADSKEAPAGVLDAPLLAAVPDYGAVHAWAPAPTITHPNSAASEAYHFAASSLSFVMDENNGTSVVVTSAGPDEGKTVTALNLAIAAMKDGRRPLLIDGDERARGLTKLADINEPLASSNGAVGVVYQWRITPNESIDFIPANRDLGPDVSGYFRSAEFRKGLHEAMADRDIVIIDAPPAMAAAETAELAAESDAVVFVVEKDTPLRRLSDARDRIELTGTPVVGYVYNKSEPSPDSYYSYTNGQQKPSKTEA
jgi:Mrp family chromosome partitioning ATPase/capsular polysaccharide biosynthesis protein